MLPGEGPLYMQHSASKGVNTMQRPCGDRSTILFKIETAYLKIYIEGGRSQCSSTRISSRNS